MKGLAKETMKCRIRMKGRVRKLQNVGWEWKDKTAKCRMRMKGLGSCKM